MFQKQSVLALFLVSLSYVELGSKLSLINTCKKFCEFRGKTLYLRHDMLYYTKMIKFSLKLNLPYIILLNSNGICAVNEFLDALIFYVDSFIRFIHFIY